MRKYVLIIAAVMLIVVVGSTSSGAQMDATPSPAASDETGIVTVESSYSVQQTMDRLEAAIEEAGLIVVARVDHAANAQSVDAELQPTQLIIFGNPELGTPLMQSNQSIGIDLPQKFLAWEGEDGTVRLTYNDPSYIAQRHGIDDQDEVIQQVSDALAMLAERATAP